MARPFYPYEADDPDLDWLVSNFLYERPNFVPVDTGVQPLVLLPVPEQTAEPVTAAPAVSESSHRSKKLPVP